MDELLRRVVRRALAGLALIVLATPAPAGSLAVPLFAERDNSIYEEGALSNGAGEHLFSGHTAADTARRALLRFDIASSPVDPGTPITAIGLDMWCTKSPLGDATPRTFSLHRVTADWGDAGSDAGNPGGAGAPAATGDATWSERFFGQGMPWTSPGGDFVATASGTTTVGECDEFSPTHVVFASTPGLVADVQGWLDDPASNFGWILIGDEATLATARRFASTDHDLLVLHPLLNVVYDVEGDPTPATSPAGALGLLALMSLASVFVLRRRARQ